MRPEILTNLTVHYVGNKGNEERLYLAQNYTTLDDEVKNGLTAYFFNSFKSEERYCFFHDIELTMNEVYVCAQKIFEDPDTLLTYSQHIAQHLFNNSMHPKVKGGEVYVGYFENCVIDGIATNTIGIFKSENRDTFLEVEPSFDGYQIVAKSGISIDKLDKGCLIYNTNEPDGFLIRIVDQTNKGTEAVYWKDDFLKVIVVNNEYHQTQEFLGIAKQFVTEQLDQEFDVSKADKIDLLNRSVAYFKTHEKFEINDFQQEVFGDSDVIASFQNFDQNYRTEHAISYDEEFEISAAAVKKQARVFKSVLKLDKNFHVYIHGNRDMLEQGEEDDGRKFYKLYYESES